MHLNQVCGKESVFIIAVLPCFIEHSRSIIRQAGYGKSKKAGSLTGSDSLRTEFACLSIGSLVHHSDTHDLESLGHVDDAVAVEVAASDLFSGAIQSAHSDAHCDKRI